MATGPLECSTYRIKLLINIMTSSHTHSLKRNILSSLYIIVYNYYNTITHLHFNVIMWHYNYSFFHLARGRNLNVRMLRWLFFAHQLTIKLIHKHRTDTNMPASIYLLICLLDVINKNTVLLFPPPPGTNEKHNKTLRGDLKIQPKHHVTSPWNFYPL